MHCKNTSVTCTPNFTLYTRQIVSIEQIWCAGHVCVFTVCTLNNMVAKGNSAVIAIAQGGMMPALSKHNVESTAESPKKPSNIANKNLLKKFMSALAIFLLLCSRVT